MKLAGDWIRSRLRVLNDDEREIVCECPWCGRATLYANPPKGVFICYYGCAKGGLATLVMHVDNVGFKEALKLLEAPLGRDLTSIANAPYKYVIQEEKVAQPLPEEFVPCFDVLHDELSIPHYAEAKMPSGRQLSDSSIITHGLGYAAEGRYRDRLLVPIYCDGSFTFLGRLMGRPAEFSWYSKKTGQLVEPPRYLHPKEAGISGFLYWYDHLPKGAEIVLVEGVFDAIRLLSFGVFALASFGKRLSDAQLQLLVAKRPKKVSVFYDASAGAEAARDAWLIKSRLRIPVYVVTPPGDHDPDSYGAKRGKKKTLCLIAKGKAVKSRLDSLATAIKALNA